MRFNIVIALVCISECVSLKSSLVWKRSKRLELIKNGNYAEYMKEMQKNPSANAVVYTSDYEYGQRIAIGNPEQEFLVWISTQASMLWVPSLNCTMYTCDDHNVFAPDNSSTFFNLGIPWKSKSYGGFASGVLGKDQVKIKGMSEEERVIKELAFGLADAIEANIIEGVQADGGLGLARFQFPNSSSEPFLVSAYNQGVLDKLMFTVWLKPKKVEDDEIGGLITYGAIDDANCGPIVYEPFITENAYIYVINSISMGNFTYKTNATVEQNLGTWIVAPWAVVAEVAKVANAQLVKDQNIHIINCTARFPDLEITVGSYVFAIKDENLIIEVEKDLCLLALFPVDPAPNQPVFNFGTPFNRQFCVVFDIAANRIGFAQSFADGPRTPSPATTQSTKARTTKRTKPPVVVTLKPTQGNTENPTDEQKTTSMTMDDAGTLIFKADFVSITLLICVILFF